MEIVRDGGTLRELHQGQVDVAYDRREDVVEVMGHAACKKAKALQLLGLHHLLFQAGSFLLGPLAIRDVLADPLDLGDLPLFVEDRPVGPLMPDDAFVGGEAGLFVGLGRMLRRKGGEPLLHRNLEVRQQGAEDVHAHEFVLRPADAVGEGRVDVGDRAVGEECRDVCGTVLGKLPVPFPALLQRPCRSQGAGMGGTEHERNDAQEQADRHSADQVAPGFVLAPLQAEARQGLKGDQPVSAELLKG